MADKGTDFITFLKANYPEDYNKLSSDNVTDSMVNAVISKHKSHFDLWLKVPERIREEYHGKVPSDILEAAKTDSNLTLADCREVETDRKGFDTNNQPYLLSPESLYLPSEILAHTAFKDVIFSDEAKQKIIEKTKFLENNGYSRENALILSSTTEMQNILLEQQKNNKIDNKEFKKSWKNIHEIQHHSITNNIEEHPELKFMRLAREINRGKLDKETALPQMEELMKEIRQKGLVESLDELTQKQQSQGKSARFSEQTMSLIGELKVKTADIPVNNQPIEHLSSHDTDDNSFRQAWKEIRTQQLKIVKKDWVENQPEKLLAHIAKELNRGKIDKETALPQMDVLMKKVKTMGRDQQLEEYLKQPQSGYQRLNEENKALFHELMLSNEVGSVAQSINKIRQHNTSYEASPKPINDKNTTTTINIQQMQRYTNKVGR